VIVQDADLEYDPAEYGALLAPLLDDRADVVYGSRFHTARPHRVLYFWHSVGNRLLTTLSNMSTDLNLTDMETCYKAFRREVLDSIRLQENRFGFEAEITAKVAAGRWRIYEVGVSYSGRTYEQGKKIDWRDGVKALYCIMRYSPMWASLLGLARANAPTRSAADRYRHEPDVASGARPRNVGREGADGRQPSPAAGAPADGNGLAPPPPTRSPSPPDSQPPARRGQSRR
jgi:hypothetical protein